MIVVDGFPFSFVEKEGLRVYEMVQSHFWIPSCRSNIWKQNKESISSPTLGLLYNELITCVSLTIGLTVNEICIKILYLLGAYISEG
ncbi:hypothetical protein H5410_026737 [Solanum commersonii]|uniref:Uncharacterized protein n=1 Tax=Solanum commersonii TaxID=4109 RepID=A0A9J5YZD1_SOLCO|nr:hypothetical protein H5410_026737 [Solanum commersonii]